MTVPDTWTEQQLQEALRTPFAAPVTAYLTDVFICSCCAVGVIHHDARPAERELFRDGQRIRTSDIQSISRDGHYWVIYTASQSRYVLVTFHADGGEKSFIDFLMILSNGFYSTPGRLH
ncbi:hypothetical protein D3C77_158230 [compost metagenome]